MSQNIEAEHQTRIEALEEGLERALDAIIRLEAVLYDIADHIIPKEEDEGENEEH
jgi:hypothetical protein